MDDRSSWEGKMRTAIQVGCIALAGICMIARPNPASAKEPSREQIEQSCIDDVLNCADHCKTHACDEQCDKAMKECIKSGGIFIDPQEAIGTRPKHRKPISEGYRPPNAGMKQ
jgi:hypothetical protein